MYAAKWFHVSNLLLPYMYMHFKSILINEFIPPTWTTIVIHLKIPTLIKDSTI